MAQTRHDDIWHLRHCGAAPRVGIIDHLHVESAAAEEVGLRGSKAIAGTFAGLPRPYMAVAEPSARFLLVAATGTSSQQGGISVFPINADGTLGTATNTTQGTYTSWVTVVSSRE